MQTRRGLIASAAGAAACLGFGSAARAEDSFAALFDEVLKNPDLIEGSRTDREGRAEEYDYFVSKAIAPRTPPSARAVSDDAAKLIILFEVTDGALYTKKYQHPVCPGGESGVTIGVGYDLGYVTKAWLRDDWQGILTPATITELSQVCGLKGAQARAALHTVKQVAVPWTQAEPQFRKNLLPRYVGQTLGKLPNAEKLSDDCLGALTSLVYNRGASFRSEKPARREMKAIYGLMGDQQFDQIPEQLLKMRRLWVDKPDMKGLLKRRELEAALFRQGLAPNAKRSA